MDDADIQRQCEQFLQQIDVPGFIVFGREKTPGDYSVTYSVHKMPLKAALLGIFSALTDLVKKSLP